MSYFPFLVEVSEKQMLGPAVLCHIQSPGLNSSVLSGQTLDELFRAIFKQSFFNLAAWWERVFQKTFMVNPLKNLDCQ